MKATDRFFHFNGATSPIVTSNIKYGRLYNWYAVSNPLFAPTGWHVVTNNDFQDFFTFLGGQYASDNGKLKSIETWAWDPSETKAQNLWGFNWVASGQRLGTYDTTSFYDKLVFGYIVTSSQVDSTRSKSYYMQLNGNYPNDNVSSKKFGFSTRLVKDDGILVPSLTDLDGNIYKTVKIGSQVWLTNNWACTKLNNGTLIPNVTDTTAWSLLSTGAYCNYNNDVNNVFLP